MLGFGHPGRWLVWTQGSPTPPTAPTTVSSGNAARRRSSADTSGFVAVSSAKAPAQPSAIFASWPGRSTASGVTATTSKPTLRRFRLARHIDHRGEPGGHSHTHQAVASTPLAIPFPAPSLRVRVKCRPKCCSQHRSEVPGQRQTCHRWPARYQPAIVPARASRPGASLQL